MKKTIIGGIAVMAIAIAVTLSVNFNTENNDLSNTLLANVEALAAYKISGDGYKGNCGEPWTNICVKDLGQEFPGVFSPSK